MREDRTYLRRDVLTAAAKHAFLEGLRLLGYSLKRDRDEEVTLRPFLLRNLDSKIGETLMV